MTGKCFSGCDRGQRKKSDFYETPYSMVWQLIYDYDVQNFIDPAAGNGAIMKAASCAYDDKYLNVKSKGFEIRDVNVKNITPNTDFFTHKMNTHDKYPDIVCNPPFYLALEFIQKAIEYINISEGKAYFLLPLSYLHGQKRYKSNIWDYLEWVNVFTRYPLLGEELRDDGTYNTGMMAYAWIVFTYEYINYEPRIAWFDNNDYVIKKT